MILPPVDDGSTICDSRVAVTWQAVELSGDSTASGGMRATGGDHLKLEKLGTNYGGWTIPIDLLQPGSICYCAGAGEDISFDAALAQRGCQVHVFDPTPRAIEHYRCLRESVQTGVPMPINGDRNSIYAIDRTALENNLHFHPWGIYGRDETLKFYEPANPNHVSHSIDNLHSTENYFPAKCKTPATIMRELGHDRIGLLKLDIEGAEGSVLENLISTSLWPGILCIEFDEALQQGHYMRAYDRICRLVQNGYQIAIEDNWNVTLSRGDMRLADRWRLWKLGRKAARKQRRLQKKTAQAA